MATNAVKKDKKVLTKTTKTPVMEPTTGGHTLPAKEETSLAVAADDGDQQQMIFELGERKDREIVVSDDEVTIRAKFEPHKSMTFTKNRWAQFTGLFTLLDTEAKELNRKTRPVAFRRHVGDGYYVSVNDGVMCVDIRKFFLPYGLQSGNERPTKAGIALRLSEWGEFYEDIVPIIHHLFPSLANAKPCYEEDEHYGQLGMMACASCNPFDHTSSWS